MKRLTLSLAALAILASAGVVHGLWTDRWRPSRAVELAVARMDRVPTEIGQWKGRPIDIDERELAGAHVAGHLARRYENAQTGAAVALFLVCGRPGQVSVHTPDVCYEAAGYAAASPRSRRTVRSEDNTVLAETWVVRFNQSEAAAAPHLRLFWTWRGGKAWEAADNPRLRFAAYPTLYKLYVVREMRSPDEPLDDDPCLDFMRQLFPELEKTLFSSDPPG